MINSSTRGWRSKEKGRGFRRETAREVEGRRGTRAPFSFLAPPKLLLTHLKQPFPSLSSACHSGKEQSISRTDSQYPLSVVCRIQCSYLQTCLFECVY